MIKKITILFLLFISFGGMDLFSQKRKIDSLLAEIKIQKEDTSKINSLHELAKLYRKAGSIDEAVSILNQAVELAMKINSPKKTGRSYNLLGSTYNNRSRYKEALDFFQLALKYSAQAGDVNGMAGTHANMGIALGKLGRYNDAIREYTLAGNLYKSVGNKSGYAGTLSSTGNVYEKQGNYADALKAFYSGLRIKEELKDQEGISACYSNISMIYLDMKNFDEASKNINASLMIRKALGDEFGIAVCYGNMANLFLQKGNLDTALKFDLLAVKIFEETNHVAEMAGTLTNIGGIYAAVGDKAKTKNDQVSSMKNYLMALESHSRALKIQELSGDVYGITLSTMNLGATYFNMNKMREAKKYFSRGIELAVMSKNKESLMEAYFALTQIDSSENNYKASFIDYKLYIMYRDSLMNEENTKKTVQTQMQYEFDKKSSSDSIKNEQAKKFEEVKHKQEISKQRTITFSGIAGFVVMLVVAGISFRAYRQKQKANKLIEEQKAIVDEKQKEILDSIYYARRIQRSLLTSEKYIGRCLNSLNK